MGFELGSADSELCCITAEAAAPSDPSYVSDPFYVSDPSYMSINASVAGVHSDSNRKSRTLCSQVASSVATADTPPEFPEGDVPTVCAPAHIALHLHQRGTVAQSLPAHAPLNGRNTVNSFWLKIAPLQSEGGGGCPVMY